MPIVPRRPIRATALVLSLAAGLAACGGDASPSPTASRSTAPPSPTPTEAGAPSPTPARSTDRSSAAPGSPDLAGIEVRLEPVAEIPGAPLAIASPANGSGTIYVAERGGRIWSVSEGQRSEQPYLDIASRVTAGGEQGLLGLAFHPAFPDDPRFFVYYTSRERDQVVAERRMDRADPARADPDYERELLRMDDFAGNHNGGGLAFGPDGFLYIATGDGGGAGDPQLTGQRLDTLLGKILRIGVDAEGDRPYTVPADNPFVDTDGALPEIWHFGLRNPWRFSFDRETDDLWIGDVGQGMWEEIDVDRTANGGLNFGWSVAEGRHCFREEGCETDGLTAPVTEYSHELGCSVTGGVVYRGDRWPALRGAYLFGDYCSGTVWAIDASADAVETPTLAAQTGHSISSFGEDESGEVYVTDLGGSLLLRVVAD